jgi:hypothetical protein
VAGVVGDPGIDVAPVAPAPATGSKNTTTLNVGAFTGQPRGCLDIAAFGPLLDWALVFFTDVPRATR